MSRSTPTNRLHKTSHIFISERAKPRRVSNFHPENIPFNSCWVTPATIRSILRSCRRKLRSGSSRIGLARAPSPRPELRRAEQILHLVRRGAPVGGGGGGGGSAVARRGAGPRGGARES